MSIPFEVFYVLGTVLLGAALAYGMMQSSKRNRANDRVTEKASRELYRDPENYGKKEKQLEKEVRPS